MKSTTLLLALLPFLAQIDASPLAPSRASKSAARPSPSTKPPGSGNPSPKGAGDVTRSSQGGGSAKSTIPSSQAGGAKSNQCALRDPACSCITSDKGGEVTYCGYVDSDWHSLRRRDGPAAPAAPLPPLPPLHPLPPLAHGSLISSSLNGSTSPNSARCSR